MADSALFAPAEQRFTRTRVTDSSEALQKRQRALEQKRERDIAHDAATKAMVSLVSFHGMLIDLFHFDFTRHISDNALNINAACPNFALFGS